MELDASDEPGLVVCYSISISFISVVPIYFVGWDCIRRLRPASRLEN